MPKGSEELTNARKEEIITACAKLYETMSFKEITIKEIGTETSFTRTSIYNYFQTKEEIFLALMQKEYELWIADLEVILNENETMTKGGLANALASSLEKRERLLKLLSMNHYDTEAGSRLENLIELKKAYSGSMQSVKRLLQKFCSDMSREEINNFIYAFFPFMFGIYPYAVVTYKQKRAMELAGTHFIEHTIYELIYKCAKKLLGE